VQKIELVRLLEPVEKLGNHALQVCKDFDKPNPNGTGKDELET